MSRSSLFVSIALLAGSAAVGWTAPKAPLPALALTSLDGDAVPAASVVRKGRWLLVYVSPHSGGSGPLLRVLEGTDAADRPSVVVVVAADAATAKAMARSFEGRLDRDTGTCTAPTAPGQDCRARGWAWYADPTGDARRALGLIGVPVVLGVSGDEIQWTLSGGVPDRRTLRSILVSWR